MQDELTCGSELSPIELLERDRNDVLQHLLLAYPATFSVDELVAELAEPGDEGRSKRRDYQEAISDLRCVGLVHQHGVFVWASRAAKAASVLVRG